MYMNLQHLYYFQTLAKLQHFAKSASELYITQPCLSYAITALEKELGVKLVERTSRSSQLTDVGEVFLTYVNRALEELEKGKFAVKSFTELSDSYIRIITEKTFLTTTIVKAFKSEEIHQNMDLQLTQNIGQGLYEQMRLGNFDFGISASFPNIEGIEYFEISDFPLVLLVPKTHPLANQGSINLYDVDWSQTVISRSDTSITVKRINAIYKMVGFNPDTNTCRVKSSLALATMVEAGLGIGLSSYYPQLESFSELRVLKIHTPDVLNVLYFFRRLNAPKTKSCEAFFSYVQKHYAISAVKTL
ncbi:LysR family transcriptional regulator [Hominifimenecus sp. rT4P-3]|uniref:LysR family transcriptional regulator n=1 Tax=Hominifimenecus sp. rT4P-3 TaxID=3242979 RepID=UPI003DA4ADCE